MRNEIFGSGAKAKAKEKRTKLLVMSFFPAFTPPRSGGELRLLHLYRELSKTHNIVLITSTHHEAKRQSIVHCENFIERRVPKSPRFIEKWQTLRKISGKGDLSAPCLGAIGKQASELHLVYLEEYPDADMIVHESPFTIDYDLFFGVDAKPRVYNSYNCEAALYAKLHPEAKSKPIRDLVEALETKLLKGADLVCYCGEDDLRSFATLIDRKIRSVLYLPNGTASRASPKRPAQSGPVRKAVFIGSGHLPNIEAAKTIAEQIAPAAPDIEFHIIGECLPPGFYPKNVIRHGLIDNSLKESVLADADVAINPMIGGSGSNLKIFDFFEHQLPVFSTSFGVRGIEAVDGIHFVQAEIANFAAALKRWTNERDHLETIAAQGRKLAIERYNWRVIAQTFADALAKLSRPVSRPIGDSHILALNDYNSFTSVGGGATRTVGLYQAAAEWSPVVFLCFGEREDFDVTRITDRIVAIEIPKTARHRARQKYFEEKFYVSVQDILTYREAPQNPYLLALYQALRSKARTIVIEHPYMVGLPHMFCDRFVYSSQNNETELKRQLLQYHPDRDVFVHETEEAESIAIEDSIGVFAVSEDDAASFVAGRARGAPIVILPNGSAPASVPSAEDREIVKSRIKSRSAVFVGSGHIPNVEAAAFIAHNLARACPDIQFHLVGGVCASVSDALPENVVLWGVVGDGLKSAIMENCRAAINPVISGSGSNVKLADYLIHGLCVVSTKFGLRGYPVLDEKHLRVAERDDFASELNIIVDSEKFYGASATADRKHVLGDRHSMRSIARRFVETLQNWQAPKARILFVTYRYTSPPLGGAESYLLRLLSGLNATNEFAIDVVSTELTKVYDDYRFAGRYEHARGVGAPTGLQNIRYARFPLESGDRQERWEAVRSAWNAQPAFEEAWFARIQSQVKTSGLAWGWDFPEHECGLVSRWMFHSAGLHLARESTVTLRCRAPARASIMAQSQDGLILYHEEISGRAEVKFRAGPGAVKISSSPTAADETDPRPRSVKVEELLFDDVPFDLARSSLISVASLGAKEAFDLLADAMAETRTPAGVRLTDARGPHSPALESYLQHSVASYDLLITHNCVFRPAIAAVEAANQYGVPVIMIPHAHLDDDFYHFDDVLGSCLSADVTLASPRAACDFFKERGARTVLYHSPGIDASEALSQCQVAAFRALFDVPKPFLLTLGRKALAKGYRQIIEAVEAANRRQPMHLVMIGPDDDQTPISSPNVTYLGQQSREVVLGALQCCEALVNMSVSESFGIVLLEAWRAKRPVIANKDCAAFRDLAAHDEDALLVSFDELEPAMVRIVSDKALAARLGAKGSEKLPNFEWTQVNNEFAEICRDTIRKADIFSAMSRYFLAKEKEGTA